MNFDIVATGKAPVAVARGDEGLIHDVQSALDFIVTVKYETQCERVAVPRELVAPDFFVLSTCLAGEILQKFINYRMKLAIYGDFSTYTSTSKPLRDFIYESNNGNDIFFVSIREDAVEKLGGV